MRIENGHEIIDYYRNRILTMTKTKIQKPLWGAHISVVRGEEPKDKSMWKAMDGKVVDVRLLRPLKNNDMYWWFDVYVPELHTLRQQLGLSFQPRQPFHLTVGRVAEGYIPATQTAISSEYD